jgi:general secretion pathway protein C
MLARLSAFVIWALVAATAVFWGLRLFVRAPAAPTYTVPVGDAAAVRGDLARLLGTAPVAAPSAVATQSLIHISEPTRPEPIAFAVFCL